VVVGNRKLDPEDLSVVAGLLEFRFCKFSRKANFCNLVNQLTSQTLKFARFDTPSKFQKSAHGIEAYSRYRCSRSF
jgi:hypothetical protein